MKTKNILILFLCFFTAGNAEAQLLKKLKKKAEQAAERTILKKTDEVVTKKTEKTIDDITDGDKKNNDSKSDSLESKNEEDIEYANPSLEKNSENKKAWYTTDVKVISFDQEKQSEMVSYFDADAVAMESHWTDKDTGTPQKAYMDSEGFFISYNEKEQRYVKMALLSMPGMNMMAPSMMSNAYKLPAAAIFEAMEDMQNRGLSIYPFMHVDFPFVLKPEHFRNDMISDQYKESKQSCKDNSGCTKFSVVEAGYEGSYTMFDDKNRLIEINIVMKDNPNFGSDKGKIVYIYEDLEVRLPAAFEKKMPGQDLLKMGLDPTNKN